MTNKPSIIEFPDEAMYAMGNTFFNAFQPVLEGFEVGMRTYTPAVSQWIDRYVAENRHPLAASFPLANPYYALCTVALYFFGLLVFFCIGRITGPCKLKGYGIFHNFVLTLWSLYMAVGVSLEAYNQGFSFWGNFVGSGPAAHSMAKFCWLFYVSKIPEFADTYIMMLKQNYRQVSFLHVFHHSSIVLIWTLALNVAPGGDSYFGVVQNSGVHVIMYLYYMLNLVYGEGSAVRKFLQANKFLITYLQLFQFVMNLAQCIYQLFIADEPYNRDCMRVHLAYMIILIALFSNFLIRGKMERKQSSPKSSPKAKKH